MKRGIDFLAGLLLTVFLITFAVTFTLNFRPLYYMDIKLLSIEESSGYPEELIRENYDRLISYNQFWNREPLSFAEFPMSENGRIHFEEVKRIFCGFEIMCFAALPLVVLTVVWMHRRKRYQYLMYSAAMSFGIPAILAVTIAAGWERFFILFHELVFRNDYWMFHPAEDPVILILPDAFFLHCAILILAIILGSGGGCLWFYLGKKNRRKIC